VTGRLADQVTRPVRSPPLPKQISLRAPYSALRRYFGIQTTRRWMDNVFIERLWRSLKYECVYLWEFVSGLEAGEKIGRWFTYYNEDRPHSTLPDDKTPMEVYFQGMAA
jgi:transposase InsO family protein